MRYIYILICIYHNICTHVVTCHKDRGGGVATNASTNSLVCFVNGRPLTSSRQILAVRSKPSTDGITIKRWKSFNSASRDGRGDRARARCRYLCTMATLALSSGCRAPRFSMGNEGMAAVLR